MSGDRQVYTLQLDPDTLEPISWRCGLCGETGPGGVKEWRDDHGGVYRQPILRLSGDGRELLPSPPAEVSCPNAPSGFPTCPTCKQVLP